MYVHINNFLFPTSIPIQNVLVDVLHITGLYFPHFISTHKKYYSSGDLNYVRTVFMFLEFCFIIQFVVVQNLCLSLMHLSTHSVRLSFVTLLSDRRHLFQPDIFWGGLLRGYRSHTRPAQHQDLHAGYRSR